ncbi:hypothetical protein ACLB2K_038171 [Fragaria x ananassa]
MEAGICGHSSGRAIGGCWHDDRDGARPEAGARVITAASAVVAVSTAWENEVVWPGHLSPIVAISPKSGGVRRKHNTDDMEDGKRSKPSLEWVCTLVVSTMNILNMNLVEVPIIDGKVPKKRERPSGHQNKPKPIQEIEVLTPPGEG